MNLHPKVRPVWQRAIIVPALLVLMSYKALRLPRRVLPRALRSIVTHWTYPMFWELIRSGVTRAYIDQPCTFTPPERVESKATVMPEFAMSDDELRGLYENGYAGPFEAFSPKEMQDFRGDLLAMEHTVSEAYGFETPRDRHLENPRLWSYMRSPAITERLAQVMGPDLLCWRSQVFYKGPHAPAIQWHQASTFMVEDYLDPAIFPPRMDEIFQLTVWIAVDDATSENGCLRFARGTHSSVRKVRFGGAEGFYNANFTLEFDEQAEEIVEVPVRSGQFLIFTERCIHGSAANTTDRHRLAFNFRAIPTSVPAYTDKRKYRSVYNGGKYHLDHWGVALLRGADCYGLSRTVPTDALARGELGSSERPRLAA